MMRLFYEHPVDPIKERYRKFGRIAPVEYGTEYPGDGRENMLFVMPYAIRGIVFAGTFPIEAFDERSDSLGKLEAREWFLI